MILGHLSKITFRRDDFCRNITQCYLHEKKPDPGDEKSPEYPKITGCPESRCENPEVQK